MRYLLQLYRHSNINFDYPIWDINAEIIKQLDGNNVSLPDLKTRISGITAVITIEKIPVANSVKVQLEKLGYNCICGLRELLS